MSAVVDSFSIGEHHPDPILVFAHEDTKLAWMNGAAEAWLRKPKAALIGKRVAEFGTGFEELSDRLILRENTSTSYRGHDLIVNVRRTDFVCQYKIFSTTVGVALHINPKELGTSLVRASGPEQSVTMLGKMLAHELKNPLAGIRGAAQLLQSDLTEPDDLEPNSSQRKSIE